MTISIRRRLVGRIASSWLLKPMRLAHERNAEKVNLPLLNKMAASIYCIMRDYGAGLFPPTYEKAALYKSESNYVNEGIEKAESSIRSPFCVLEGRPYMNNQKLKAMLKLFYWIDQLAVPYGAKMLEVGGGTGWLTELLCVKGYNVVTTTLSPVDTATAQLRCDSLLAKGAFPYCVR